MSREAPITEYQPPKRNRIADCLAAWMDQAIKSEELRPMSNPSKPLKLTARQYQLLLHLLENLLDVSTDPGVKTRCSNALEEIGGQPMTISQPRTSTRPTFIYTGLIRD